MNVHRKENYNAILKKLRHPEKRTWIILNPVSIGETITMCAFAKAFVEHHGYGITMVVTPEQFPITQMYPDRFEQVITLPREEIFNIMRYLPPDQFEVDIPFAAFNYNLGDARTDSIMYLHKYPGRGGISFTDLYRHILMLPWEARMERPRVPPEWMTEARQYAADAGIKPGKSVILFPSTNTNAPLPDILWGTVAARLKENGYEVFCNMRGGRFNPPTMPVAGTHQIDIPLHLGLSLVSIAGRMISAPHGFHCMQLFGSDFDNLTVFCPVANESGESVVNERLYHDTVAMALYTYPELCYDLTSYVEFSTPLYASDEELIQIAIAAADMNPDHPNINRRFGAAGRPYTEEHSDWLSTLVEPALQRRNGASG